MYTVQISEETADNIFKDIFVQDYLNLKQTIRELKSRDSLKPFEVEDLESDIRWVAAMEILMEYYIERERRLELIGKDGG